METTKSELRFGGVPTDPDIKLIRDRWPDADLKAGQAIDCDDVAAVLGLSNGSNRFQTVTARWRKLVEKGPTALVIGQRNGVFQVLESGQVVNRNEGDFRSGFKRFRRGAIRGARSVDVLRLSEDEKKRHDLHTMLTGKVLAVSNLRKDAPALPTMID